MIIAILKYFIYILMRPLALYRIYPGALAFLMAGSIDDAQLKEHQLIDHGGEKVILTTSDHRQIESTLFLNEKTPFAQERKGVRPTVIFCLGNNMFYQLYLNHIDFYLARGFDVMAFNYGGYCKSEGTPTTEHTFQDVEAAYQFVKKRTGVPDSKILVHGESLGGGPASYLASKYPVHLVLDRTFSSVGLVSDNRILQSLANHFYPYLNADRIKETKGRIHLIAATNDRMMRPHHLQTLFDAVIASRHPLASDEEKIALKDRYITIVEGPHGACLLANDPIYEAAQQHFVEMFLKDFDEEEV